MTTATPAYTITTPYRTGSEADRESVARMIELADSMGVDIVVTDSSGVDVTGAIRSESVKRAESAAQDRADHESRFCQRDTEGKRVEETIRIVGTSGRDSVQIDHYPADTVYVVKTAKGVCRWRTKSDSWPYGEPIRARFSVINGWIHNPRKVS